MDTNTHSTLHCVAPSCVRKAIIRRSVPWYCEQLHIPRLCEGKWQKTKLKALWNAWRESQDNYHHALVSARTASFSNLIECYVNDQAIHDDQISQASVIIFVRLSRAKILQQVSSDPFLMMATQEVLSVGYHELFFFYLALRAQQWASAPTHQVQDKHTQN